MKPLHRTVLAALVALPVAVAGSVITAPGALAAPTVEVATFDGLYHSSCTLPYGPEGPEDGPYTCDHDATSLGCAAVVDTGPVASYVKTCHADLTSGRTSGSASLVFYPYALWTCDNGAGTGQFSYQPSPADPSFDFPVNLSVVGSNVVVSGSYTQASTGRHIVVRAEFPATCASETTAGGYSGTVTPI